MKPSNVPTGRVEGRFIIGVEDGPDPDDEPDYIAAQGTIELQMSVPYIPNPTAYPAPVTMLNARRRMILDAEGYACTPDPTDPTKPGARGMRLEADGSPDALVSGWTWNITYRFDPVNGSAPSIAAHSFVMLPDAVVDLTTVIKVPSSPGYGLPQAEAAVLRAESAAIEASASADVAVQGASTTDGLIAGFVSDTSTQTSTALSAAIGDSVTAQRPKLDLVSDLKWPMYVSHRGSPYRFPEHSMEGYRESMRSGFVPEPDIDMLADGTLVCIHDATVDRTMYDITGPVNNITREQWLKARLRPAIYGGKRALSFLWEDVLNEFGGRTVLMPEVRENPAAVEAFIWSIKRRGLERTIIAQSFYWETCLALVAAGIPTCFASENISPQTLVDAGIEYTTCSLPAATSAYIQTHNAAGIRVVPYGILTYASAQDMLNNRGAFGIFSDDPWAHSGLYVEQKTQTYNDGIRWIGSDGYHTNDSLVPLGGDKVAYRLVNATNTIRYVEQGWGDRIWSRNFNIEWDMKITGQHITGWNGTESARIYLSPTLHAVANESQADWLSLLIRRNGQAVVYRKKNGVLDTLATANGFTPVLADGEAGERYRYKLSVDIDGNLTISRSGSATVMSITAANYALHDQWGLWLTSATGSTTAEFSDWNIYQ